MTSLNQQMVIPTCRRIASRFQCYLLMYFKMNDKKKTSCFLICLCCISLQISFFSFLVSTYIKCFDIPFQGKLQLKETFQHLIRKMISEFFSVKPDGNYIALAQSAVCVFFRRIWIFFANPDRTPQKIKKFQIVLCSLKFVLIFQLNIQDICQIQHNFKTLQEANKFIENYEIETKVCVILDV